MKDGLLKTMPMVRNSTGNAVFGIHAMRDPATIALKITNVQLAANAKGALRVRLAIV